jgi:Predicted transcriptional regulators
MSKTNEISVLDIDIEQIKKYENNPRENAESIPYVVNSIKEYGFKNPIVLDSNMVIIAGHTRFEAAKILEMKTVPCIIAEDLTEEQAREFRLIDNKTAELSYWNFDKLLEEISHLECDLTQYGFNDIQDSIRDLDDVDEITEDNYKNPEQAKKKCPACGHVDFVVNFRIVKNEAVSSTPTFEEPDEEFE